MTMRVSPPSIPAHVDVRSETTVLVRHPTGATLFGYAEPTAGGDLTWIQRGRYEDLQRSVEDADVDRPDWGEFRVGIEIAAPVEHVFEYVADIETHEEYADFVDRVEFLSERKRGEGMVFTQVHTDSDDRFESEVIEFEPNETITWVVRKDRGNLYITYTFDGDGGSTTIAHRGISPLYADPDVLEEAYGNNVREMNNLNDVLT